MLAGSVLALIAVMWRFPEIPLSRALREATVMRLATCSRHHVLFVLIVASLLVAGSELIAIAGSYDLAIAFAWDLSLYVDVAIATAVIGIVARVATMYRVLRTRVSPAVLAIRRPRGRTRRSARPQRPVRSATDDEGAGWQLALAR